MKKIMKLIVMVGAFFVMSKTCMATIMHIELGEEIPNSKVHIKTANIEKNENMHKLLISEAQNELVYSMTSDILFQNGYYTEEYYNSDAEEMNLKDREYISKLVYYGYGYQNRTDIKWYIATQYLIWDYLIKENGEIYFIDDSNHKIELYEEEREIILNDVKKHDIVPSFLENYQRKEANLKNPLVLEDENYILNEYEITSSSNVDIRIEDNRLLLSFKNPVTHLINFTKKLDKNLEGAKIYYNSDHMKIFRRGLACEINRTLFVDVAYPTFTLKIEGAKDNLSLKGGKYNIFYENDVLYSEFLLNEQGEFSNIMNPGKYYLKEIKAPYGYELSSEKIPFSVTNDNVTIRLSKKAIEKKLSMEAYLTDELGTKTHSNSEIEIINSTGVKVGTLKTDELGKSSIDLTYDTYKITQIKGEDGYHLVEPLEIKIDENFDERKSIIIKNEKIIEDEENQTNKEDKIEENKTNKEEIPLGSLTIMEVDAVNGSPLKNIGIVIYDSNKKSIKEAYTNEEGKIILEDLPIGKYYIKELVNLNYELNREEYEVEIKEGINSVLTIANRMKVNVPITGIEKQSMCLLISTIFLALGAFIYKNEQE